ncbi:AMP-binding protein [Xanthobacter dioxanivorans]|uniref:3-methylmercaptopropionyl-CoA ligase n=1 Tax=Xanthobacter dioxanivorans TaxID=2528964 RepID=A0A974PSG3_9HYPH|nr:acyl-CoA synthetase [Xanthobacter dioxanivorans]QRG08865.1 AMP-binding protein [Xanthobacter dioxanivorans]
MSVDLPSPSLPSPASPEGGVARSSRRVMNLSHFLRQAARRFPTHIGFVDGPRTTTWAQMDARVDAMAAALAERGIGKGDRILVQSKNCLEMFESMFAAFRLGAVWVPTNFRQTPGEVAYLASASGATAMICHRDFPEHVAAVREATPSVETVIAIGEADFGPDYDGLVSGWLGRKAPVADVEHDDPCWFFFTSGTTGRPKAAVLTHGQMAFVVTNHLCDLMPGTTQADASLVVAPLSHGAGVHQLAQVARAVKTILMPSERFDAGEAWRLVEEWRVTNMFTVPTITKLLAEHPAVNQYDHSSLRYVIYAGAPMYREDQKRALKALGKVLVQYFGLGEVTGNITVLPPALHDPEDGPSVKLGTCGFERTGMQVQIQDAEGREVAPLETGEICVCGPAVFAGYYDNPEANAKSFRDGWFRTGDLGHMDAEGFVYITGRASDMYISGGSNVYPREVEEKMLTHPAVAEVAILGVPDRMWGEVGVAVCVLREGASVTEEELIQFLDGKVARYKLPRRIHFWDALPRSAYGKITKKMVREALAERGLLETDEARSA